MTMTNNVDARCVARYPVGQWPMLDPGTDEVLVDELGRRSYVTSIAYLRVEAEGCKALYDPENNLPKY